MRISTASDLATSTDSPFHIGEQAVQSEQGVRAQVESWGRQVVRGYLPDQHRAFYASLGYLILSHRDVDGLPAVHLLHGTPGFVQALDPARLSIASSALMRVDISLKVGDDIGILGIDLATRRRNRVNGRVIARDDQTTTIQVDQSFGNCPQHISERLVIANSTKGNPKTAASDRLDGAARQLVRDADTFFVGTGFRGLGEAAFYGMDASHRGGPVGFVEVVSPTTLRWPDYAGNNHFNTVGNLRQDPRIGMLFVDFATGDACQIAGTAEVVEAGAGAIQRWITVDVEKVIVGRAVIPLRWARPEGLDVALEVVRRERSATGVLSIYLERPDHFEFTAGQYVPVRADVPGIGELQRTYSLSRAPEERLLRITVKRQGVFSTYLHDQVRVGDYLLASAPLGDFVVHPGSRPLVLVGQGVGITPLRSMLGTLVHRRDQRPVVLAHSSRNRAHQLFAQECLALAKQHEDARVLFAYSQELVARQRYGRIDAQWLLSEVGTVDADFYICGGIEFAHQLAEGLVAGGVKPERMKTESF